MPSSVIKSFDYNSASAILRIVFVSGIIYEYKDVPETVYQSLKSARSKGIFLNRQIKTHYSFRKIN